MSDVGNLASLLDQISQLLASVGEGNWSTAFEEFSRRCGQIDGEKDRRVLEGEIRRIYGGMGSFSDLVLYSDGQVLVEENRRLEALRNELFEVLVSGPRHAQPVR